MGGFRQGFRSRGLRGVKRGAWLLAAVALLFAWNCAPKAREYPIFEPTAPFLAEQERVRKRAEAVRNLRGSDRVRNVVRFREKTLAAWDPIYRRVRQTEASRERLRASGLDAAQIRAFERAQRLRAQKAARRALP